MKKTYTIITTLILPILLCNTIYTMEQVPLKKKYRNNTLQPKYNENEEQGYNTFIKAVRDRVKRDKETKKDSTPINMSENEMKRFLKKQIQDQKRNIFQLSEQDTRHFSGMLQARETMLAKFQQKKKTEKEKQSPSIPQHKPKKTPIIVETKIISPPKKESKPTFVISSPEDYQRWRQRNMATPGRPQKEETPTNNDLDSLYETLKINETISLENLIYLGYTKKQVASAVGFVGEHNIASITLVSDLIEEACRGTIAVKNPPKTASTKAIDHDLSFEHPVYIIDGPTQDNIPPTQKKTNNNQTQITQESEEQLLPPIINENPANDGINDDEMDNNNEGPGIFGFTRNLYFRLALATIITSILIKKFLLKKKTLPEEKTKEKN